MTQYLLSVWHAPMSEAEIEAEAGSGAFEAVEKFNTKLIENGHFVFAGGLHAPDTATVLRPTNDGDVVVTDGPFAEVKENLGGFWVINAADLDEALALGTEAAAACRQPVEVRPFQEEPPAEA
jgi:hypothetical protein